MPSVIGANTTLEAVEAAAFWLFHTPPPVVPRKTVFPLTSEGSSAIEEILPVTSPYEIEFTAAGPAAVQAADPVANGIAAGNTETLVLTSPEEESCPIEDEVF
jgi:hypothetical protein